MATGGDPNEQRHVRISDVVKEPQKMLMPIRGFEKMPIVSLEQAVEPLLSILPDVQDFVYIARERCEPVPADGLTIDESASIMLYTMEWDPHEECLYFALNATLRSEDRQKLKPWFSYLKLFLTALDRLPSSHQSVYRGVKMNLTIQYPIGKTFVWWGFSSCASSIKVLENEQFLGKTGDRTLFTIDCETGKDISRHSYFQSEDEILLLAARQFVVKSCLEPAPGLNIIQLKETESPIALLQSVQSKSTLPKPQPNVTSMEPPKPTSIQTQLTEIVAPTPQKPMGIQTQLTQIVAPAPQKPTVASTVSEKKYLEATANNSTKEVSTKPKEVAQAHTKPREVAQTYAKPREVAQTYTRPREVAQTYTKPESQEFATPGTYRELCQIIQYI